jgi:uncharacterized membrane protein
MMQLLKAYPFIVAAIVILDLLWLGVVMKDFYRAQLGHLMGTSVVWGAALVFYLVFAAGLAYFAVLPALAEGSWVRALFLGALLGALCYATYDLTNHATLRDWPLSVTVLDIVWGAFLSGAAATTGYFAAKILG